MTDKREVTTMAEVAPRRHCIVRGRVVAVNVEPRDAAPVLTARLDDGTGQVYAVFLGRREIPGLQPGTTLEIEGLFGGDRHIPLVYNPRYELLCRA